MPFVTTYHPGVKNLKQILMQHWSLIQNQPLLKTIYKTPPIISYKRGISLNVKPHSGVCVGLSMPFSYWSVGLASSNLHQKRHS